MTTPMKDWPMTDMVFFLRTSPPWTKPAAGVCSMTKVVAQSILKSGFDAARDDLANVSIPSWNAGTRNQFRVHRVGPVTIAGDHLPCDVPSVKVGFGSPADVRGFLVTGVGGVKGL